MAPSPEIPGTSRPTGGGLPVQRRTLDRQPTDARENLQPAMRLVPRRFDLPVHDPHALHVTCSLVCGSAWFLHLGSGGHFRWGQPAGYGQIARRARERTKPEHKEMASCRRQLAMRSAPGTAVQLRGIAFLLVEGKQVPRVRKILPAQRTGFLNPRQVARGLSSIRV